MKRKFDPTDLKQCIRIISSGLSTHTEIYCVECDKWRGIRMIAMARVDFTAAGQISREVDESSATFECVACGADVEYLLNGQRSRIIGELAGVK